MSEFIKEKLIGEGTFGTVWLVKSYVSPDVYVLKDINMNKMTQVEKQRALTEVTILKKCRHNNIIGYQDSLINRKTGSLCILMDYADGGDLLTAIKNQNGVPFSESTVISWFIQICLALQYIHYNNILHRDLKCKNIFLTKNKVIKVGDFGIARILKNSEDLATTKIGTPYYLSPEMCNQLPYNSKSDMWALGCILFEMSALEHPFEANNFRELITAILKMRRRNLPNWSGPVVRELVEDLLEPDPIQRPSADEILAYPSLQPYLVKFSAPSKIPYLVQVKKLNNAELLEKKDNFKRASEKNFGLEVNKVRFTSTGKLHVRSNSQMTHQVDFKKVKGLSENGNKIQIHPDSTKDSKIQASLDNTYLVSSCPQNQEKFSLKIHKDIDCGIYQNEKDVSPSFIKPKQSRPISELSPEKCKQKGLKKKVEINVINQTDLSTSSSSSCASKFPCLHSQCHQCMMDMLWKNRIQGCQKTSINKEEYSELQNKLLFIFKKEKFHSVYYSLLNDWNAIGDFEISSKRCIQSLTHEQMQHLPLMMQLIQLDILMNSVMNGKT